MDHTEYAEINNLLKEVPDSIDAKGKEAVRARTNYKYAKAMYDTRFQRIIHEEKLTNPDATITDLKAKATVETHKLYCKMIARHSRWMGLKQELDNLRDQFDALKERSWNFRATVKRFQG